MKAAAFRPAADPVEELVPAAMTLNGLPQIGLLDPHTAFSLGHNCTGIAMASPARVAASAAESTVFPPTMVTSAATALARLSGSGAAAAVSRQSDRGYTRSGMRDRDSAPQAGS